MSSNSNNKDLVLAGILNKPSTTEADFLKAKMHLTRGALHEVMNGMSHHLEESMDVRGWVQKHPLGTTALTALLSFGVAEAAQMALTDQAEGSQEVRESADSQEARPAKGRSFFQGLSKILGDVVTPILLHQMQGFMHQGSFEENSAQAQEPQ